MRSGAGCTHRWGPCRSVRSGAGRAQRRGTCGPDGRGPGGSMRSRAYRSKRGARNRGDDSGSAETGAHFISRCTGDRRNLGGAEPTLEKSNDLLARRADSSRG